MASGNDQFAAQPGVGRIILAAIRAARAIARRVRARYQQVQQARTSYEAFRRLDAHTLRDLGLHRSELMSVAAEYTREAGHARVRTLRDAGALAERD
jgi:uncharacterized protein YjiS (DUF1127 family)